jgi:hypothetical protein
MIGFGIHQGDVDGITVCKMFNHAISESHPFIERVIGTIRRLDHVPFWTITNQILPTS